MVNRPLLQPRMGAGASAADAKAYVALFEANKALTDEELLVVFQNYQNRPMGISLRWMREFMEKAKTDGADFQYLSTKDVCIDYVIPVCCEPGESYLSYLAQRGEHTSAQVGPAKYYISHTWKYYYSEVLEALENYFEKEEEDVFVYFDLFCNDPKVTMSADHQYRSEIRAGRPCTV